MFHVRSRPPRPTSCALSPDDLRRSFLRGSKATSPSARSWILEYAKGLGRSMGEIVRIVKGLQLFDASHLMAPANWPHNEIVGDIVVVPPSTKLTADQVAAQHVAELSDWSAIERRHEPAPENSCGDAPRSKQSNERSR